MEEILAVFFKMLIEVGLQVAAYVGIERSWGWGREETQMGCGYIPLFLILGGLLGGVVNLVHPALVTPWPVLQVVGLVVWPVTAGCVAWLVCQAARQRGKVMDVPGHVTGAVCFVLAFNVVRYVGGTSG